MSTKTAFSLSCVIGSLVPLSVSLADKTGFNFVIVLGIVGSFVGLGLLAYAAFRERTTDDKSERVPPKVAAVILSGIGLWVVFCFYRVLAH